MEDQGECQGHDPRVEHVIDVHSGKRRLLAAKVALQGPVAYDYGGFGFMRGIFI